MIANRWEDEKCSVKSGTAPPGVFQGASRDRCGRAGKPQARVHACCQSGGSACGGAAQARSGCDNDTQQSARHLPVPSRVSPVGNQERGRQGSLGRHGSM